MYSGESTPANNIYHLKYYYKYIYCIVRRDDKKQKGSFCWPFLAKSPAFTLLRIFVKKKKKKYYAMKQQITSNALFKKIAAPVTLQLI